MILDQPLGMVVQREQARGGKKSDLTHRTAEHASIAFGSLDNVARSGQKRAARRAEPFREGNRDKVEGRG